MSLATRSGDVGTRKVPQGVGDDDVTVEMAIWRMAKDGPVPLKFASLDLESRLEDMLFADPSLTGTDLLVVGRQIRTAFASIIDLVGVDVDGRIHVLELKRDRTPRDAVAQVLDYGVWAKTLSLEDVSALYAENNRGAFDEAFAGKFGASIPDVFNAEQQLTIVASQLDPPLNGSSNISRRTSVCL